MKLRIKFARPLQECVMPGVNLPAYTPSGGAAFPKKWFRLVEKIEDGILEGAVPSRIETEGAIVLLWYREITISMRQDVFSSISITMESE